VLVADLERSAQGGWGNPFAAAVLQWLAFGADDDAADLAVAGDHAGAGGGDEGAEAGAGGAVTDIRVDEVGERDGDDDVRLDGAQDGQVAGGEGVVGQLHQRVAELLGTVPQIALRPVGLHHRFEHGLDLLPADRVELEPAGHPAVVVPGEGQRPAFGGVGFGTVGVEPLQVVVHHLGEVGVRPGGGDVGRRGVA
jgi:hypothetical protein